MKKPTMWLTRVKLPKTCDYSSVSHDGENTFIFSKSTSGGGDGVSGTKVVGDCIDVALHIGHVRFLLYINQDHMHAL